MIDRLHYITQQPQHGSHIPAVKAALKAGCKWIQLRVKDTPEAIIMEYALEAKALCEAYGAKLIINDHPGIALKVGADGLHLGLQDMPLAEARKIVGKQMIIGGTANTFGDIQQRVAESADYIGLGPYRFTTTKQKLSPVLGIEGYSAIMKQVRLAGYQIPVIAIGGIVPGDVSLIMETGVFGIAVSGAITFAADPAKTVENMYQQLQTASLNEA